MNKSLAMEIITGLFLLLGWMPYVSLLFEGDNCTVPATNETGRCINIEECSYAIQIRQMDGDPKFCGFLELHPLVCCPIKRLSEEKCIFYYDIFRVLDSKAKHEKIQNNTYGGEVKQPAKSEGEEVQTEVTPLGINEDVKGQTSHPMTQYIIYGGEEARESEIPHMAAIGYISSETNDTVWECGGSLISHYFVVSAAHCVESLDYGLAKWVRLGDLYLNDTTGDRKNIRIVQIYIHPSYKPPSYYHDIALFRLEERVDFNYVTISPACLHVYKNLEVDTLQASGWGKLHPNGDKSIQLMKVDLEVVNHTKCFKKFNQYRTRRLVNGIVDKYQLCAGDETGKDTCPGDSGGPLHYYRVEIGPEPTDRHPVLAGITSFGKGCGGTVGVYTRVSAYVEWIENIVWQGNDTDLSL